MTNPDTVERLRELLGKATEGPWRISERGNEVASTLHGGSHIVCSVDVQWGENRRADNAALIVEAINALPALLAVVEAGERLANAVGWLMSESDGVAGLHQNGNMASWGDLVEGGNHEEWLIDLSRFDDALANLKGEG